MQVLQKYADEKALMRLFVDGDPPSGDGGLYPQEFTLHDITGRLLTIARVNAWFPLLRKLQVLIFTKQCHQTSYWEGYYFRKQPNGNYKVEREDVSGLPPG